MLATLLFILGSALALAGVVGIVVVLVRRMPTVALINPKNVPVDRSAQMKEQIIADRILRDLTARMVPVRKLTGKGWGVVQNKFRRLAKSAFELERKSEHMARLQWDALTSANRMHAAVREADALVKDGAFGEAEKKYIEALAIDSKNVKTYEKLGNLYLKNKQYEQARETFRFASRLSPNDASVVAFLGEIAFAQGHYGDAITYFQHAVSIRPRSPRYLDFLLQACILGGNRVCAKETLEQFAAVNPENAKLREFDKKIREMV